MQTDLANGVGTFCAAAFCALTVKAATQAAAMAKRLAHLMGSWSPSVLDGNRLSIHHDAQGSKQNQAHEARQRSMDTRHEVLQQYDVPNPHTSVPCTRSGAGGIIL